MNDIYSSKSESIISSDSITKSKDSPSLSEQYAKWRWVVLILTSLFSFSCYFCYDNPNSLSDLLKDKVIHDEESSNDIKYNMLYSVYAYPNIILPLIGGFIIDKFGIHFASIMFTAFLAIGQGIFTIAGYMETDDQSNNLPYTLAIVGRIVFGIGGDSVYVCSTYIVSRWFKGKELSLSLSVILSIACCGTVLNNHLTPVIAENASLGFALLIGCALCFLSFLCSIAICILEIAISSKCDDAEKSDSISDEDKFNLQDIKELNMPFWLITILSSFSYTGLITFANISNDFFCLRYNFTHIEAARITGNTFAVAVIFSPLVGSLTDRFGHRITSCMISSALGAFAQSMFAIIPPSDPHENSYLGIMPLILIGVSHCIFMTSVWPMICIVVKPKVIGSAYGICTVFNNIGLGIAPIMVGLLTFKNEEVNMYFWANIFLCSFCVIGLLLCLILFISDKHSHNGILQKPSKNIEKYDDFEEAKDISTHPYPDILKSISTVLIVEKENTNFSPSIQN